MSIEHLTEKNVLFHTVSRLNLQLSTGGTRGNRWVQLFSNSVCNLTKLASGRIPNTAGSHFKGLFDL